MSRTTNRLRTRGEGPAREDRRAGHRQGAEAVDHAAGHVLGEPDAVWVVPNATTWMKMPGSRKLM
jgi:hypothetical protein